MKNQFFSFIKSTKILVAGVTTLLCMSTVHSASAIDLAQSPLFLAKPVAPIAMLNMSNDHQLYFKVYDDYSDVDGDGAIDLGYNNNYPYYGYFNEDSCYTQSSGVFVVQAAANNHYCTNAWSGNFLNWATMTRIDVIRKILYGGKRFVDSAAKTVLERTLLPTDAHSFTKYYNGDQLSSLTPYSVTTGKQGTPETGITICSTTHGSELSHTEDAPPMMLVARGNYSLWASNERHQCIWDGNDNGNNYESTGIYAYPSSPSKEKAFVEIPGTWVEAGNVTTCPADSCRWRNDDLRPVCENTGDWGFENGEDCIGVTACNGRRNLRRGGGIVEADPDDCTTSWEEGYMGEAETVEVEAADLDELIVRVESCNVSSVPDINNENCKAYGNSSIKPVGLLQQYGEDGQINFGLLTGSYTNNKSGGVLRKNAGSMVDEVNLEDGTFKTPESGNSIVETLDLFRIYGYNYSAGNGNNNGTYNDGDSCYWGRSSFTDGECSNWGNPQSEIYLESLRYLAGKAATISFNVSGDDKIAGLKTAAWALPLDDDNYCAPLNVIQFNASTSSYDGNSLGGAADIGLSDLDAKTKFIGINELGSANKFFVGSNGTNTDKLCTAKTISDLSAVSGTCPYAPRHDGSYQIAGLAYHARLNGLGVPNREKVKTYGVALAPAVPSIVIPVPGKTSTVTIIPACRNSTDSTNCAIVDFKVVNDGDGNDSTGRVYVNWEDSEQGGDFDQDMWGIIDYAVTGETATVTTEVMAQSAQRSLGFGYILSGTTDDGFHVASGINDFIYAGSKCAAEGDCTCRDDGAYRLCSDAEAATDEFTLSSDTSAKILKQPLYYAAKWGSFDKVDADGVPTDLNSNTYFAVTNPRALEKALKEALDSIIADAAGSAASVAANSTRLSEDTYIYQGSFDTVNWSGDLKAIKILSKEEATADGTTTTFSFNEDEPAWSAAEKLKNKNPNDRNIFTYNDESKQGVEFQWNKLSAGQQAALNVSERVSWLRGNDVSGLRERAPLERLGDIINSDPVYGGTKDYGFGKLSGVDGASSYSSWVSSNKTSQAIYVGANDGMLHAFNAETTSAGGNELFAYIPAALYGNATSSKLKNLSNANYGKGGNYHKYTVDGQIFVGDAYVNGWKTLLVGSMGAGAKGFFVLDVTTPESFSAADVLFESNETDHPEVGHILGKPTIAPLPGGGWAVIIGNGYNSSTGKAQLLTLNLETMKLNYIDTAEGAASEGLAEPSMTILADGTVDYAYAGDYEGNMWKFDLSTSGTSGKSELLFAAGATQPITVAPVLGLNYELLKEDGSASTMVYYGTGSYIAMTDVTDENPKTQAFYGVADTSEGEVEKDKLYEKTLTDKTTATRRYVTDVVNWGEANGWFFDLPDHGERVVTKSLLAYDRTIFPTLVPSSDGCGSGGGSWIMEIRGVGEAEQEENPHTILDEGSHKTGTLVSLSDLIVGKDSRSDGLIVQQNSDGTLKGLNAAPPPGAVGRQSWRQLQ